MVEFSVIEPPAPTRGQSLFAMGFVLFSLTLWLVLPFQTTWIDGTSWYKQPRFWPTISLSGMVLFGLAHFWRLPRYRIEKIDLIEAGFWVRALEFPFWFMLYVFLVPNVGYLLSTVVFVLPMIYRQGYRRQDHFYLAFIFAISVVVLFKVMLEVKIPGAALYELFPPAIRNFLIVNF